MGEIEKEKVEFPACATLWQGNLHRVAAPYFLLFMYMIQLYKEDWPILHMLGFQAIAFPSTELIGSNINPKTFAQYDHQVTDKHTLKKS